MLGGVWKPASSEVFCLIFYTFQLPKLKLILTFDQILEMTVTTKECVVAAVLLVLDQVNIGGKIYSSACLL